MELLSNVLNGLQEAQLISYAECLHKLHSQWKRAKVSHPILMQIESLNNNKNYLAVSLVDRKKKTSHTLYTEWMDFASNHMTVT